MSYLFLVYPDVVGIGSEYFVAYLSCVYYICMFGWFTYYFVSTSMFGISHAVQNEKLWNAYPIRLQTRQPAVLRLDRPRNHQRAPDEAASVSVWRRGTSSSGVPWVQDSLSIFVFATAVGTYSSRGCHPQPRHLGSTEYRRNSTPVSRHRRYAAASSKQLCRARERGQADKHSTTSGSC